MVWYHTGALVPWWYKKVVRNKHAWYGRLNYDMRKHTPIPRYRHTCNIMITNFLLLRVSPL